MENRSFESKPPSPQATQRRSRPRGPPPRLEWPAPFSSLPSAKNSSVTNSSAALNDAETAKRKVRKGENAYSTNQNRKKTRLEDAPALMWVDKYAPTKSSDLCVAPKKVKEVREWMQQASQGGRSKLLILTGMPGVGKSSMVRVLASELGFALLEWDDTQSANSSAYGQQNRENNDDDPIMYLHYQSQLGLFEDFLRGGSGFKTLSIVGNSAESAKGRLKGQNSKGTILLIEELPNLYNDEAGARFRSLMSEHIQRSVSPTVLIFTAVSEGKTSTSDLQKIIDESILFSPLVNVINCNAVTTAAMKKCLSTIANRQNVRLSSDLLESICMASAGDLRSAVMSLQFQLGATVRSRNNDCGESAAYQKDTRLSSFHALGKILYAKRQAEDDSSMSLEVSRVTRNLIADGPRWQSFAWTDKRPPLGFDPEEVLNQNDLGPEGAVAFLAFHAPDFFTDETELSEALGTYSDAAMFLNRVYQRDNRDSIYPVQYIASLAGRAVADANKNPAPGRFRSFCAPRLFDVMRKQSTNKSKLDQLCKRLAHTGDILPIETCVGSMQCLVTDSLPYIRTIFPTVTNYTLSNMDTMAKPADDAGRQINANEEFTVATDLQRRLLAIDDIIDDEDDIILSKTKVTEAEAKATAIIPFQMKSIPRNAPEVIVID